MKDLRRVVLAAAVGNIIEWYDFYIYGTLGAFLAKYFFSNVPPNVAFIFTLLAFAAAPYVAAVIADAAGYGPVIVLCVVAPLAGAVCLMSIRSETKT